MEEKKLVPKKRFSDFGEKWITYKFGDQIDFYSGLTYSPSDVISTNGTFVIRSSNVKNNKIVDADNVYVENSIVNSEQVKNGDIIVVVRNGSRNLIGKNAVIRDAKPNTVIGAFMTGIRSKNYNFTNALLNTKLFKRQINENLGATINQITTGVFSKMIFNFPSEIEQQKIGEFFKVLEERIANQERKIAKVKSLKDAYLTEMFPQEGETVPKRRFKGFEGKWKSKLVDEIMDVTSVKRIHQSDWEKEGIRFLRARDLVSFYKNETVEDTIYISKEKYSQYIKASGKVNIGDLLVTGVGTIGVPMLITNTEPIYFKDGNIIWFKNNNKLDGYYLYYYFTTENLQNYIKNIAGIGTVGTYTIDGGKQTPICFPEKEEQQKIGAFFKNLDNQIEMEEKKLDKLQKMKEAYLEEMFV